MELVLNEVSLSDRVIAKHDQYVGGDCCCENRNFNWKLLIAIIID